MRWELSDEQDLLRSTLRSWLAEKASPAGVRKLLDADDPQPFEDDLASAGWSTVGFGEEHGGQGGGLVELAVIAEEFGRAVAPDTSWLTAALAAAALPELTADGKRTCLVVDGGRPLNGGVGVVGVDLDDGRLSGSVATVIGADRAQRLVVPAGEPRRLYVVDANDPGVRIGRRRLLDRSRSAADVTLSGATGRALDVDATAVLQQAALRAAVLVAADALGVVEQLLELAVEYSKQRKQFGVPIGSFQAVKHAAATMLVQAEAARSVVYYAAASVDEGHPGAGLHAAVAKAQVTAAAAEAADTALTMHGAIGYTWEHDLHLLYKRAKLDARLFGTPQVWNERIATALPLVPTT